MNEQMNEGTNERGREKMNEHNNQSLSWQPTYTRVAKPSAPHTSSGATLDPDPYRIKLSNRPGTKTRPMGKPLPCRGHGEEALCNECASLVGRWRSDSAARWQHDRAWLLE